MLLDQAYEGSEKDPQEGADNGDHPALHKEYIADKTVAGAQIFEGGDIIFFVKDEHCQRAYNIKRSDDKDKGEDHKCGPLFGSHYPVKNFVLFISVLDNE